MDFLCCFALRGQEVLAIPVNRPQLQVVALDVLAEGGAPVLVALGGARATGQEAAPELDPSQGGEVLRQPGLLGVTPQGRVIV